MTSDSELTELPQYGTDFARDAAGQSPRAESGLTGLQDQRLTALAIKRGWLKGQRWATEATRAELLILDRDPTAKEKALLGATEGVQSADPRVVQAAVRNIIAMEAQNQKDDSGQSGQQVNVGLAVNDGGVRVYLPDNGRDGPTAREVAIELLKTAEGRALLCEPG